MIQLFLGFVVFGFSVLTKSSIFFSLALVFGVLTGFGLDVFFFVGCFPRYASFIASISLSLYNPVGPMYLKGFISRLLKRILTASEVIPKRLEISETGIPSIYESITPNPHSDQANSLKRYNSITQKANCIEMIQPNGQNDTFLQLKKKIKIFYQNLDNLIRRGYIIYRVIALCFYIAIIC